MHPPRAERLTVVCLPQPPLGVSRQGGVRPEAARVHVPVAGQVGAAEAFLLNGPGAHDAGAHSRRARPRWTGEMWRHRSLETAEKIDAVQQRTAEPPTVSRDLALAAATAVAVPGVPAGTWVGGGHEHEARGEHPRALPPDDRGVTVLQRLTKRLERRPGELGELVQEQDTVVGQAGLARDRPRAAADQPRCRDRVVGRAEWAL